jgi:hypothetical protein
LAFLQKRGKERKKCQARYNNAPSQRETRQERRRSKRKQKENSTPPHLIPSLQFSLSLMMTCGGERICCFLAALRCFSLR